MLPFTALSLYVVVVHYMKNRFLCPVHCVHPNSKSVSLLPATGYIPTLVEKRAYIRPIYPELNSIRG
jgi:hypothetical protein